MHIIVLSKLYKGDPTKWLRQIDELREDKRSAMSVYAPLRNAILSELENGDGDAVLEKQLQYWQKTAALKTIKANSRKALRNFKTDIVPEIIELEESYLSRSHPTLTAELENPFKKKQSKEPVAYKIEGRFHFSYLDAKNNKNYAYIHNSHWPNERKEAFIELLAILVEEYYGCKRRDVAFIDLSGAKGVIERPSNKKTSIRKDLLKVLRLLSQISDLSNIVTGETSE